MLVYTTWRYSLPALSETTASCLNSGAGRDLVWCRGKKQRCLSEPPCPQPVSKSPVSAGGTCPGVPLAPRQQPQLTQLQPLWPTGLVGQGWMALLSEVTPLPHVPYLGLSSWWGRINTAWESLGFFNCQNVLADTFYMLATNSPTNHVGESLLQSWKLHWLTFLCFGLLEAAPTGLLKTKRSELHFSKC